MNDKIVLKLESGEVFYGGAINDGCRMPFGREKFARDLRVDHSANQATPTLISSHGRYIHSSRPFRFEFDGKGKLTLEGGDFSFGKADSLRAAYREVRARFWHPAGHAPPRAMFENPQFNTWIDMGWQPTQEKVLAYARDIVAAGHKPGVLMIDDGWAEDYGDWRFAAATFPDPAAMTAELHRMGFTVMVWVCPFVSPDSGVFRMLRDKGFLARSADGRTPAVVEWWDGFSAQLDLTHPGAVGWFTGVLDRLMTECGVDGFKFDASDPEYYRDDFVCHAPAERARMPELWAQIGEKYAFNEMRACYGCECRALMQREKDRGHRWDNAGLGSVIADALAMNLCGFGFNCADMVGGGLIGDFAGDFKPDEELFIRYAQAAALFPMMQFSLPPVRVLSAPGVAAVDKVLRLRERYLPAILRAIDGYARTGEPIMQSLEYAYPGNGLECVTDEFILDGMLVAPVLTPGGKRTVHLPDGHWTDDLGNRYTGGAYEIEVALDRLPIFVREA